MANQNQASEIALFSEKTAAAPPAFLVQNAPRGNETVAAEDMAMPRLKLMQALSPEVNNETIKPGVFLNSITNQVHDSLYVINLHFQKDFAVYKKRDLGGGWVCSADSETEALQAISKLPGTKDDYEINESHRHLLCILDKEGKPVETVAFYMASKSLLYTSRAWNTELSTLGGGNVDRFASVWKLTAEKQSNTKGSWHVAKQEFAGWVTAEMYAEIQRAYGEIVSAPTVIQASVDDIQG